MIRILLKVVSELTHVSASDILGQSRFRHIVQARHLAIWLACVALEKTHSASAVGHFIGGRDHTTVLYARAKVEHLRATDPHWQKLTAEALQIFSARRAAQRERLMAACHRLAEELRA
ncbi:MAG: hypothetical protein K2X43_01185 [Hyphomonadaceae bacterium]|nr:hypothetical protein [Hyphomonadaceae bacterium]